MGRWSRTARAGWSSRLALFAERGFEQTRRGDRQAGRADRADVLPTLRRQAASAVRADPAELILSALAEGPPRATLLETAAAALEATGPMFRSAGFSPGNAKAIIVRTPSCGNAS